MDFENYLDTYIPKEDWRNHILDFFETEIYEEDEMVLKEGQKADKVYFIEEGILHAYSYIDIDKVLTEWLLPSGHWGMCVAGYVKIKPAETNIKSLVKTQLRSISRTKLNELLFLVPELGQFVMMVYEQFALQQYLKCKLMKIKKLEDRLDLFERQYPGLSGEVKQKILASYLNTSATELSRVRSKRMNFQK